MRYEPPPPRQFVWQAESMKRVVGQAKQLGKVNASVLISGETGTGKEILARMIHESGDPSLPFVPIDCSAFASDLLESELFGHVKGAFTGAIGDKVGLIELANGGTAFFDEIGELPLHLQAKLLRLLQEKEFRPVGANQFKRIEFRAIAATHRDLRAEVRASRFREDLYYRLAVVRLRIPALRERREDIPVLIQHFLERTGAVLEIPPHVVSKLSACDWPGNVRQLENCISCMAAIDSCPLHEDGESSCENLGSIDDPPETARAERSGTTELKTSPAQSLADYEKKAIISALQHAKGNVARAALLLDMGRTTLYRKIRTYQLESLRAD